MHLSMHENLNDLIIAHGAIGGHEFNQVDKESLPWEGGFCIPTPIFFDGGGDMREVNGFFLFELGYIWQLAQIIPGPVQNYHVQLIGNCYHILNSFINNNYNKKDLPDSVATAKMIVEIIDEQVKHIASEKEPVFTASQQGQIYHYIMQLRALLSSELGKLTTILLEEKRGYSVSALWKQHNSLLPKGIITHLSKFVKSNLIEAGKCLIMNCHTAVGFHSMRSVEHVSRKYYHLIKGKPPIKPNGTAMGLGSIAQEFIDLKKSSDDLGIIGSIIKGLCNKKRDPLAHPEIIALKEEEAIDTFIDTIQIISKVVEDAKRKGAHFTNPWNRRYLF